MNRAQKLIAYIVGIIFAGSLILQSVFAEEIQSLHSIDELPSSYLEGSPMIHASIEEESITTSIM